MRSVSDTQEFRRCRWFSLEAFFGIAILLLCFVSVSVASEKRPVKGIIGPDNRQPVDTNLLPWASVGQINITGFRRRSACTGTLIGPQIVLTAAHCVIDGLRKAPYDPLNIHFLMGVRPGNTYSAHSVARCVHFPRQFLQEQSGAEVSGKKAKLERLFNDIAIVVLRTAIDTSTPLEILRDRLEPGEQKVMHAGYSTMRRFQLLADRQCRILENTGALHITDCDGPSGSSGGPVLVERDGRFEITSIIVGAVANRVTLAVPLATWPSLPLDASCP